MINDSWFPIVGLIFVALLITVARMLFQSYRNRGRVCRCCHGRNIIRKHEHQLIERHRDHFVVDSTTVQICTDPCCPDRGKRDEVKGYPIRVNVGLNFRYLWRFRRMRRYAGQVDIHSSIIHL